MKPKRLATLTAGAFWDETTFDIDPTAPNPFYLAYANDLLIALDILPLVIDKALLEELLGALGIELDLFGDDFEIVISGIPYFLPIDIGPWFAEPSPTGLKDLLWNVVHFWDLISGLLPELLD